MVGHRGLGLGRQCALFGRHVGRVGARVGEPLSTMIAAERLVTGVDADVLLKETIRGVKFKYCQNKV